MFFFKDQWVGFKRAERGREGEREEAREGGGGERRVQVAEARVSGRERRERRGRI